MELYIENFKAIKEMKLDLSDFAILQGPNGSGKTTIIQALILAIEGKLPGIHDKELFAELAREGEEVTEMTVGLKRGEEFSFKRRWICKEKFDNKAGKRVSTVSQEIDITPFKADEGLTQKKERIRELISLNPISVDIDNFLGLSDAKRRDFFYDLGEAEILTDNRIKEHLVSVKISVDDSVKEHWQKKFMNKIPNGQDKVNLDVVLTNLARDISTVTAIKRIAEMTARRMIEVKARRDSIGGHLKDLEEMLVRLQNKKTDLEKDIESNKAKAEVVKLTDERKNEYTQRIINLEKQISDDTEEVAGLNESLNELDAKVAKTEQEFTKEGKKLEKAIKKKEDEIEDLDKVKGAIAAEFQKKQAEKIAIENGLMDHTPHLSKKSIEYLEGKRKDIQTQGAEEKHTIDSLVSQLTESSNNLIELKKALNKMAEDKFEMMDEHTDVANKLKQDLAVLLDRIPKAEEELTKTKELVKVSDGLPPPEEVVDIQTLQDRLEGIKQNITDLEPQVKEKRSEMELLIVQTDAESDLKQAEIDLYCLKAMQKALGPAGLKGELVKATLDPIKKKVNEALRILGYEREFDFQMIDSRGNECFNFGWKTEAGDRLIKFNALSTGEQTVLLTAMVAVICSSSEHDVKFLAMDNVEVISTDHEEGYFAGLPKLAELCELDYFYVCTSKDLNLPELLEEAKKAWEGWRFFLCPLEE